VSDRSKPDSWDPTQYNRFAREREQPFWDLAALVSVPPGARVVDLGCGDGRLTAELHRSLAAATTRGFDSSAAMIAASEPYGSENVTFALGDLGAFHEHDSVDLVFANASLQWVPNHAAVLRQWRDAVRPGGQLAVQVPANADHPTHVVADEVAREFLDEPPVDAVAQNVLKPEQYAVVLNELGATDQRVRLQVYGHKLPSTLDAVEWVKGTTLTRFKAPLGDRYDEFVHRYTQRLLDTVGEHSPFFYPFKRILFWAVFEQ
jgi:trans-aconitate 2-methyltransferase